MLEIKLTIFKDFLSKTPFRSHELMEFAPTYATRPNRPRGNFILKINYKGKGAPEMQELREESRETHDAPIVIETIILLYKTKLLHPDTQILVNDLDPVQSANWLGI